LQPVEPFALPSNRYAACQQVIHSVANKNWG
jgi:hypothetical protein